jgi:hypothetical protein
MIWLYLVIGLVGIGSWLLTFVRRRKIAEDAAEKRRLVAARDPAVREAHLERARALGRSIRGDADRMRLLQGIKLLQSEGALDDERVAMALLHEVIDETGILVNSVLSVLQRIGSVESLAALRDLAAREDIAPETKRSIEQTVRQIARREGGRLSVPSSAPSGSLSTT